VEKRKLRKRKAEGLLSLPVDPSEWAGRIINWYERNCRELPWRGERDPYRVWLSEVMLQQTQVKTVIPYYRRFLDAYPTLEDLAAAAESEVLDLWAGLGYYRRARNLHQAARIVVKRWGGRFPDRFPEALALPGIGRYSAGAVLSLAFDQPYPVLDGNVRRVLIRFLKLRETPSPTALWRLLEEVVAKPPAQETIASFNQGLMELGALVCTPRNPVCGECPLRDCCGAKAAGLERELPAPVRRRETVRCRFTVAVIGEKDRFLMRVSRRDPYLAGFWEFPKVEGWLTSDELEGKLKSGLRLPLRVLDELPSVRHHVTFRRLEFRLFRAVLEATPTPGFHWIRPGERGFPISAWVDKVLRLVDRWEDGGVQFRTEETG
jgi:A/G-specific adenine glycosylase